jgi:nicotinamidase-related amidase
MSAEVTATAALLDIARAKDFPIIFTTIAFDPTLNDAGIWPQKSPTLRDLESGSRWVEIDPRLSRRTDEIVIVKKGASAFFGTNLVSILISQRVDSVILCGATTSGCIRATAIDLLQYGFPTLVPQQCVADRATAPHHANLFDIDSKYANVVPLEDVLSYIDRLTSEQAARI